MIKTYFIKLKLIKIILTLKKWGNTRGKNKNHLL